MPDKHPESLLHKMWRRSQKNIEQDFRPVYRAATKSFAAFQSYAALYNWAGLGVVAVVAALFVAWHSGGGDVLFTAGFAAAAALCFFLSYDLSRVYRAERDSDKIGRERRLRQLGKNAELFTPGLAALIVGAMLVGFHPLLVFVGVYGIGVVGVGAILMGVAWLSMGGWARQKLQQLEQ